MWKSKPVKEPDKHIDEYWSGPKSTEGLSEFKATNKPSKNHQIYYIKMKHFRELRRQAKFLNRSTYNWLHTFTVHSEPSRSPGGPPPVARTEVCVSGFRMGSNPRFPECSKHSQLYLFKAVFGWVPTMHMYYCYSFQKTHSVYIRIPFTKENNWAQSRWQNLALNPMHVTPKPSPIFPFCCQPSK